MPAGDVDYVYESEGKQLYRDYVKSQFRRRSLSVSSDGKLLGKWLEPIGSQAKSFEYLLASKTIDADCLIGIDLHPAAPLMSQANIEACRLLFPESSFYCQSWWDFCHLYQGTDVKYIVYDLYTSTTGVEFRSNMSAIFSLVKRCLTTQGQVLLAVTVDLTATLRQRKGLREFEAELDDLFTCRTIRHSSFSTQDLFRYKTSTRGNEMGALVLEFFNQDFD